MLFFKPKQPKTDKGAANLERMCGKLLFMLKKKPPLKIEQELNGLINSVEKSIPCSALDVKIIEHRILLKLEELKTLLISDGSRSKIIEMTGDIALLLISRGVKVEKYNKNK